MESEGTFTLEANPFTIFENKRSRLHFNQTRKTFYEVRHDSLVIYGRIFPQIEPYCHASFLIEINISPEYPFRMPEITFLDLICHPNIDEKGKLAFCWWVNVYGRWNPNHHLVDVIRKLINIDDHGKNITHNNCDVS